MTIHNVLSFIRGCDQLALDTIRQEIAARAHPGNPQPVDLIRWVEPAELRANDYNPNQVFSPEMRLLELSIAEDGWTQPIVARPDLEIVDGFHRYTIAGKSKRVQQATGGLVPIAPLEPADAAHQRMSTIRHNRARGKHHVVKMASIVGDLAAEGLSDEEIGRRLQMDKEEVSRLKDRGSMIDRHGGEFGKGWTPGVAAKPEEAIEVETEHEPAPVQDTIA